MVWGLLRLNFVVALSVTLVFCIASMLVVDNVAGSWLLVVVGLIAWGLDLLLVNSVDHWGSCMHIWPALSLFVVYMWLLVVGLMSIGVLVWWFGIVVAPGGCLFVVCCMV